MDTNYQKIEHFCTLFDSNYLPMGLNLHSSLVKNSSPFHLWILCVDKLVEEQLKIIDLEYVTLIAVSEIETEDLLRVKEERSRGEYCWTLTPFIFLFIFENHPEIQRLTYIDADLFFFRDPMILLNEFEEFDRDILITEHAYAPEYDQTNIAGRFCVQFLACKNTLSSKTILRWWGDKCLAWCSSRLENGKLGDQKYLDLWPVLFPDKIWILQQKENTLAPWNVKYFYNYLDESFQPVFFHFHTFKIISKKKALLYIHYNIGKKARKLYISYINTLKTNLSLMYKNQLAIPTLKLSKKQNNLSFFRYLKYFLFQRISFIHWK